MKIIGGSKEGQLILCGVAVLLHIFLTLVTFFLGSPWWTTHAFLLIVCVVAFISRCKREEK